MDRIKQSCYYPWNPKPQHRPVLLEQPLTSQSGQIQVPAGATMLTFAITGRGGGGARGLALPIGGVAKGGGGGSSGQYAYGTLPIFNNTILSWNIGVDSTLTYVDPALNQRTLTVIGGILSTNADGDGADAVNSPPGWNPDAPPTLVLDGIMWGMNGGGASPESGGVNGASYGSIGAVLGNRGSGGIALGQYVGFGGGGGGGSFGGGGGGGSGGVIQSISESYGGGGGGGQGIQLGSLNFYGGGGGAGGSAIIFGTGGGGGGVGTINGGSGGAVNGSSSSSGEPGQGPNGGFVGAPSNGGGGGGGSSGGGGGGAGTNGGGSGGSGGGVGGGGGGGGGGFFGGSGGQGGRGGIAFVIT